MVSRGNGVVQWGGGGAGCCMAEEDDSNTMESFEKTPPPPMADDRSTKKTKFRSQSDVGETSERLSFRDQLMKSQKDTEEELFGSDDDLDLNPEDLWNLTPGFNIIDLENDFYLVRFKNARDADYVLTSGPWTIMGHYLTVQPWSLHFDSSKGEIDKVVAWIRLPGMALQYYHKKILRRLGQIIGSVIRIDYTTESAQRGKFARIAVEIDLKSPLISQFHLDGKIQRVEYDNLPVICFYYGKYDHYKENCSDREDNGPTEDDVPIPGGPEEQQWMSKAGNDSRNEPKFGPWMVVARKGKPRVEKESNSNQATEQVFRGQYGKESRFNILANLGEGESNHEEKQDAHMERTHRDNNTINSSPTLSSKSKLIRRKDAHKSATPTEPGHMGTSTGLHAITHTKEYTAPQSPFHTHVSRGVTNLHANHASPKPLLMHVYVPTSLNPLHHLAISFSTDYATAHLPCADVHPKTSNGQNSAGGHLTLSELDGDPPNLTGLAANMDMEDDANDSDYVATSEDRADSSEGDVSLVEETAMDLVEEASQPLHGKQADDFIKCSGFEYSHRIEATGFSGAVYTNPNPILRRQLWDHLDFLARTVHGPWLVGGDFNSILCTNEKKCGSTHIYGVCDNSFGEFVSNAWINSLPYLNAADIFVKKALEWNRDHFGNIFQKKRRILLRLGGIQKVLETKSRRSLASETLVFRPYPVRGCFPILHAALTHGLMAPIEDNEIRQTIFSMKPLKAPGVDGLHAIFYQSQWHIVGHSFCKFIKNSFSSASILKDINTTLLVLIPKALMPILIGPQQTSFVLGRHITDNIVIAQEVIHSMRKKAGKKGFMAIKVDLEKAYDRLNWDFIYETLQETGLPRDMIQIIMACITSATMRVLWNGEASDEFVPCRGIRQGDPLSPYIFVLCVERLSHGINKAITAGDWRPIRLARRGTPLTRLFFAVDLLLLAEADIEQAGVINMVLNNFCQSSEAKVNKAKSQVFFSKNILVRDMKRIGAELGFSVTKDLGTITLTQTVLQVIPVYAMQTTSLPIGINMKIDKACRKFIWSGNSNQQRMSMVSWDTLCKPKAYGGLGLKELNVMNKALLMKLSWGIISAKDNLWVQVLCTKYGVNNSNPPLSLPTRYGSHMWKAIGRIWSDTMLSRSWSVGDGKRIRFWWDCWVYKDKPLANQVTAPIPDHLTNLMVADCVAANGQWNRALFDHFLPHTAIMKIASIHPPSDLLGPDQFYWSYSNKGNFSASSAYNVISSPDNSLQDTSWNMVWKWQGPQGVKVFIWLALHGRLKTKAEIARRHMVINTECDRCGAPVEDILHVLRDSMGTKGFWYRVIPVAMRQHFFQAPFKEWMINNLQNAWPITGVRNWVCFFGIAIWRLWFWRNQFWVNGLAMDSLSMVNDVKARTKEVILIQGSSLSLTNKKVNKWIGWSPPNWPWCKLNSDGACKVNGVAAAGGLIRDHSGHWVAGFGLNIGNCSVTTAELWGLYQGLTLAWNKGIRWLCVEVDSRCVTQLVKNNMVNPNEFSTLIHAIQELIRRNWRVEITHVYREANFAADYLATLACSLPLGLHVLNSPPKGVLQFMSQDNYGVVYPRLVIS
ncbi:putative ribonuclease H protein [Citrus sinensis]|uniref:Ribonuclease H protein n=1 Tax=Citrus sinensis TaxID=2711 RepID=A0ACB8N0G4_CITSI|nr:putative ribonuclease H protein [Citrus sinensis]